MAGPDKPRKSLILILLMVIMVFPDCLLLNRASAESSADYELLVIGPESYRTMLKWFLDFKETQGVKANYFSIEWIDANVQGQCIVEKLHEFIAGEYRRSCIKYLLLVGTYEQVPTKYVYSPSDEAGLADFNYKPSDWYYAVPDWNDSEVGLLGGNIPKFAVGRLPVRNREELDRLLQKIVQVEREFKPGLFLILSDQNINAGFLLDILNTSRKVIVESPSTTLDAGLLNNVTYLVSITHGNPDALFTRTPDGELKVLLACGDADKLGVTYAIHYMAACFAGSLDLGGESLARTLVTSKGGPGLVIASSRTERLDNPILFGFWERFLATGDVGCSFIEAVESYLLDQRVFSSSKPSFSSYNFYLDKVIYGDVSWRIKDPEYSIVDISILSNTGVQVENNGRGLLNENADEPTVFLPGGNSIILLLVYTLSLILAAEHKIWSRSRSRVSTR